VIVELINIELDIEKRPGLGEFTGRFRDESALLSVCIMVGVFSWFGGKQRFPYTLPGLIPIPLYS
jgi:hypothetical protein